MEIKFCFVYLYKLNTYTRRNLYTTFTPIYLFFISFYRATLHAYGHTDVGTDKRYIVPRTHYSGMRCISETL